jgi:hypothetical protein
VAPLQRDVVFNTTFLHQRTSTTPVITSRLSQFWKLMRLSTTRLTLHPAVQSRETTVRRRRSRLWVELRPPSQVLQVIPDEAFLVFLTRLFQRHAPLGSWACWPTVLTEAPLTHLRTLKHHADAAFIHTTDQTEPPSLKRYPPSGYTTNLKSLLTGDLPSTSLKGARTYPNNKKLSSCRMLFMLFQGSDSPPLKI